MFNFNDLAAKADLPDQAEFDEIMKDVQYWIILDDFDEYMEFLDEGLACGIAETLARNNSTTKKQHDDLEEFFFNSLEHIRCTHNERFDRRAVMLTHREKKRLLVSINNDLHALGADFTNMILGVFERETPISKHDLKPVI